MIRQMTHAELAVLDEIIVRNLRDDVYGQKISDKEWENCKANWVRDRAWLEKQVRKAQRPVAAVRTDRR